MIDFHNHVIPDIDDGSKSIEMSIEMLKEAQEQGITDVVSTIHFQHPKMDGKNTDYSFVNAKRIELQKIILKHGINIRLHLSAEVFYLPNLTKILDNPLITVGDGKFMLIEFSTLTYHKSFEKEIYNLQNQGIIPIIAHPERYKFIDNDLTILKAWIERDFILQIDSGSILGHFGERVKSLCFKIMENYGFHLMGSDAHNTKKRNFCLKEGYDFIDNKYGKKYVPSLKNNAELILEGQIPDIIIVEQKSSLLNIIKGKFT